jgi:hypothetical protein
MSVNSMVDSFLGPLARAPRELEQTARRSGDQLSAAVKRVVTYIPTEVVATYILLVDLLRENVDRMWQWVLFWLFLLATPLAVWVTFVAKIKRADRETKLSNLPIWPWWPMIAATISFGAWAIALPGSVINTLPWFRPAMGAVTIVLAAFVVGLLSKLFR